MGTILWNTIPQSIVMDLNNVMIMTMFSYNFFRLQILMKILGMFGKFCLKNFSIKASKKRNVFYSCDSISV